MKKEFTNENRTRYYGLRVGDIVNAKGLTGIVWGRSKVLELVPMDNNSVIIESKTGKPIEWTAEWCEIVTKVEDIVKYTKVEWIIKDKPFFDDYSNVWKIAVYCDRFKFCQYICGRTEEEAFYTAKLFTAASELLEAIEDAKKQIDHLRNKLTPKMYNYTTPTTTESLKLIETAIKKATE